MMENPPTGIRHDKKCDICSRCFARSEHLARHRRTHTKEKPFSCPYCRRSFQRSDVKAFHVRKCPLASSNASNSDTTGDGSGRKRVRIACDGCRKRKMKCNGKDPCESCQSNGVTCHFAASSVSSHAPTLSSQSEVGNGGYHDQSLGATGLNMDEDEQSRSLPFTMQNSGLGSNPSSLSIGLDSLQGPNHDELVLAFQEGTAMPVYENSTCNEGGLSLPNENSLYPLSDSGAMNSFWQMPAMNTEFWFDESDLAWSDGFFSSNSPTSVHVFPSSMQNWTAIMQEYFDRKSRAPSPSLNKASRMWYSAPPDLDNHNRDIVRVFLNIFRKHIPETFSLFKGSTVSQKDRAAYTLAMAATGGSFCTVPGSAEVAKVMYNDARRLLLASFNSRHTSDDLSSPEEKLTIVKTFILLELYGLCSGGKRSYEFVEAFHSNLIQSVQEYSQACKVARPGAREETEQLPLLEALCILDCYRVIIMQRPPSLSWHHIDSFAQAGQMARLFHAVVELTDGSRTPASYAHDDISLASLAYLCIYVWPSTYSRQNSYGADMLLKESLSLWKGDFAGLACNNWLRTSGKTKEPSHLAVYHMLNIMLHTNLTVLQSFAHSAPGSAARDPKKSLAAREMYSWTQDRHYKIARWHAEDMIASIEGAFMAPTDKTEHQNSEQTSSRPPFSTTEPRRLPYEAPHVAYAVYYATLVIWCGAVTDETIVSRSAAAHATIATGERLLSLHKVHIAQLLARVLNEIK